MAAAGAEAGAKWLRNLQDLLVAVDAIRLIAFTIIGCDIAGRLGVSPLIVLAGGFAVRMLAVRFRCQFKVFTAADTGGAH